MSSKNDDKKKKNFESVKLNSQKIRERDIKINAIKLGLIIMALFLIIIYFLLTAFYEGGDFTVSLDPAFAQKSGLIMYEKEGDEDKRILKAKKAEFIDNISIKWLPQDINKQGEGSHNGDNYLAYSFYIKNKGSDVVNYWYEIIIDDVIKNADEAIRVMLYRNDEQTVYAKASSKTGEAEAGTKMFYSDKEVAVEQRKDFQPGEVDKFTIVVFIEGDDPECLDNLIGGEMKMHMDITEEHILQENK